MSVEDLTEALEAKEVDVTKWMAAIKAELKAVATKLRKEEEAEEAEEEEGEEEEEEEGSMVSGSRTHHM